MFRLFGLLSLAAALVFSNSVVAEELKSGPQVGESVGAFTVEKCAGNENDGVKTGEKLCYRCKLGNRPVVAVFSRTADESVSALMTELDGFVAANEEKKAASFVNLLGADADALKEKAGWLVKKSGAKHVAVVVPEDSAKGPEGFKLNEKAEITVLVYNKGKVVANYALASADLKKDVIAKIKASAESMLN
jgi:hypothetical protein